jgi:ATP-binding protein involved in chromosome partitioning
MQKFKKIAKKIILIGSGKGGVGKSTVSVNLAVALAQEGVSVALLDADIYGPSLPIMFGLRGVSPNLSADQQVIPMTKFGVQLLSVGFFLEEARSLLWRGPLLHGMLDKMLNNVLWGECDLLLVDLPPGTGDVPMSLNKLLPIDGAVMITTPQQVSIIDVVKAINSLDILKIPTLGIIENMSGNLGDWDLFGEGKGAELAERFQTHYLGSIPLWNEIAVSGDEGRPVALHPEIGELFTTLGLGLLKLIQLQEETNGLRK